MFIMYIYNILYTAIEERQRKDTFNVDKKNHVNNATGHRRIINKTIKKINYIIIMGLTYFIPVPTIDTATHDWNTLRFAPMSYTYI